MAGKNENKTVGTAVLIAMAVAALFLLIGYLNAA